MLSIAARNIARPARAFATRARMQHTLPALPYDYNVCHTHLPILYT